MFISSAALAQTKDQCGGLSLALSPMITAIAPVEKNINSIDWDLVIRNVSGLQFKKSAETAKLAQVNFISAMRQYRIAIEDVIRDAQLCAR